MDVADPEKIAGERGAFSVEIYYILINSDVSFIWFSL
jgi:hypothetical protein